MTDELRPCWWPACQAQVRRVVTADEVVQVNPQTVEVVADLGDGPRVIDGHQLHASTCVDVRERWKREDRR